MKEWRTECRRMSYNRQAQLVFEEGDEARSVRCRHTARDSGGKYQHEDGGEAGVSVDALDLQGYTGPRQSGRGRVVSRDSGVER